MRINSDLMQKDIILDELAARYSALKGSLEDIEGATEIIIRSYEAGGKLLICGNGGSSSDSQHIAGELMKGFEHERPLDAGLREKLIRVSERGIHLADKLQQGLPVISLSVHDALITAVANDTDPNLIFAQQVMAFGKHEDVLFAISTSGNSSNVIDAIITARALDMKTIGLTGKSGGSMAELCDITIRVPESRTSYVQELHFPVYHAMCMMIENHFFRK